MRTIIFLLLAAFLISNSLYAQTEYTPEDFARLDLMTMKKEVKKLKGLQVYIKIGPERIPFRYLLVGIKEEAPVMQNVSWKEILKIRKDVVAILKEGRKTSTMEAVYIHKLIKSATDKTHYGYKAVFTSEENPFIDYYSHDFKLIHREDVAYE